MTDRLKGVVVTFTHDIREDDAEAVLNAIRMIKGVASAEPRRGNIDDQMNRARVRSEVWDKLSAALGEILP